MVSKILDLLLAIGPAIVELIAKWKDRNDEKTLERIRLRRLKRNAKKRHVDELLDAVEKNDPAALVSAANRVRDDQEDADSSDPASR